MVENTPGKCKGRERIYAAPRQCYLAERRAAIQRGGSNVNVNMDSLAASRRFDAHMDAARITLNAGIEAANLRALLHVLPSVGGMIAREIQKNIEMRF